MADLAEQFCWPAWPPVIHLSSSRFPPGHWSASLIRPDTCLLGWPATGLTKKKKKKNLTHTHTDACTHTEKPTHAVYAAMHKQAPLICTQTEKGAFVLR